MHFDITNQRLTDQKDQRTAGIPPPTTAGRAGTPLPAWTLASPRRVRQGVLGEGWVETGLVVLNLGIPPLITAGRAWAEDCWADLKDSPLPLQPGIPLLSMAERAQLELVDDPKRPNWLADNDNLLCIQNPETG